MGRIQLFYNKPHFEKLVLIRPFQKYLKMEMEQLKVSVQGGKVLDIGCGTGRSTEILLSLAEDITGVDFSKRLLNKAQARFEGKNIALFLENAESMHFEKDCFDYVVLMWNTFGNLYSSRDKVLKEAKRIVKPMGKILLSVLSDEALPAYLEMLKVNKLAISKIEGDYIYLNDGLVSESFSKEKLLRIFDANGFKSDIKKLTNIAYWCEIRK